MFKWKSRFTGALASALLLSVALTGCGGAKPSDAPATNNPGTSAPAAGEQTEKITGKLMIYTSIYPDIITQVEPELKKAFPDLKIEWFQSGTEKVVAKLAGEIEANKIGADLLMVADPAYYIYLKDQNLLAPHKSEHYDAVIVDKDADAHYTGVRVSNVVIAYNTNLVKPEEAPKSFQDLLDPKWKDQVVIVDPNASGTALVTLQALTEKYGWDYYTNLKNNGGVVGGGNSAVEKKLITGEFKVGIILEENILKVKDKGEPVDFVYPTDGTIIIPSPIGMFKATQNEVAAKAVMDWWLSPVGQQAVVDGWMHGVTADAPTPKGAKALKEFAPGMPVNWVELSKNMGQLKEDFTTLMGTN